MTTDTGTEQVLARLLTEGRRFAPEYGHGLSNHRPMALLALQRLGADASRLQAWAAAYEARLRPAPPPQAWPAGDAWTGRLGERSAWPAYRDLFMQWIAHEGAAETLEQVLPALMPGVAAAAFHGAIRVAAAARSGHPHELADALAYWASRWRPLGPLPAGDGPEADPEAILRRLKAGRSTKRLIADRMADAARDAALHAELARLAIDDARPDALLQRLARLAAKAYALSGSFTALHLVTGCHAMHVLWRFAVDRGAALRAFWQAYGVAVVAAQMQARPAVPLRPWLELTAAAIAQDDEHVIKLVEAGREEERAYGGDDWRAAASRALA
jgi:hypothetical protein